MQDINEDLKAAGAQLVAITPQNVEKSRELVEKHKLDFPLLIDPHLEYSAKLGIRFELPPEIKEIYSKIGIKLDEVNEGGDWTLPIPMRLVVDQSGTVRVTDIDVDYTRRPEPAKTLEDVKAL